MRGLKKVVIFVVTVSGLSGAGYGAWRLYDRQQNTETKQATVVSQEALTKVPKGSDVVAFEQFEAEYSKSYNTEEARLKAFKIFVANKEMIDTHNAAGDSTVVLAINEFADIHPKEFAASRMGLRMGSPEIRNFNKLPTFKATGMKVPDSVDWRDKGAVTPVKNQGQCGSCWSFSTTGALEGRWQVLTGKLCSMSEQQFVDCDTKSDHGCQGGLMDYAFTFAEEHALCSEDSFPYKGENDSCPADLESTCDVCIPKGSVTGFQDVESGSEDAMKEALSEGPVSVAIEADQGVFQFYKSGVVTSKECGQNLDHGVLAVGYGDYKDEKTGETIPYWLVKNSWGSVWGQDGYVMISRTVSSSGESECGILSQPSFPKLQKASDATSAEAPATAVTYI